MAMSARRWASRAAGLVGCLPAPCARCWAGAAQSHGPSPSAAVAAASRADRARAWRGQARRRRDLATSSDADGDAFSHFSAEHGSSRRSSTSRSATACSASSGCRRPSSTKSSDGLGPLYNARACQSCHLKDGRGHPPRGPAYRRPLGVDVSAPVDPAARPTSSARRCAEGAIRHPRADLRRAASGARRPGPRRRGADGRHLRGDAGRRSPAARSSCCAGRAIASPISATGRCIRTR